jgi:predicted dienelactone hydrolase
LGIVAAQADNVEAKGHYFGTLQTGLEQIPIVEWVVLAGGDKLIPSDKDAARWYEVVSNPGKTIDQIDQARRVSKAVDSPGFMDWLDDLLKPFDYLCGNWW